MAEAPILRHAAKAALRLSPAPIRTWLRTERIKARRGNGFALVPEKQLTEVYRQSVRWLLSCDAPEAIGDYLEFGVFYGSSLSCMHRVFEEFGLRHARLFGFDSWEGLPEGAHAESRGLWNPGDFKMDCETARRYMTEQGVDWPRVHLTKGWFSDTLTPRFPADHGITHASIIMVDCDLYSSAKEVLEFCGPLVGERAVILFDDWFAGDLAERNLGEKKAFQEFLAAHPDLDAEETETYIHTAKVFRIRRSR